MAPLARSARSFAGLLLGSVIALGALTGCGGGSEGTDTSCDLTGCTITFPRDGTPSVSVLGITAKMVSFENNQANIEVAGQTITVPVGGETQSEGWNVRVERATDTEIVVRVSH